MSTTWAFLIILAPFALAVLLCWAANRIGVLRVHLDQFRWAAPMTGRFSDDRDWSRVQHDTDAIRTRFEQQPSWPASGVAGERR